MSHVLPKPLALMFTAALGVGIPLAAAARTTVAIAPLHTASGEEYRWLGVALAEALTTRVLRQPDLNALTQRQVNAAMRSESLPAERLVDTAAAVRLGKGLGADILITGSYTATWPDLSVVIRVIDPNKGALVTTQEISGGLEQVFELETRVARAVATSLGGQPNVAPGACGTDHLRAWRAAALAADILNWQSLAPSAADPAVPLKLPAAALKQARAHLEEAVRYDPEYGEAWASLGVSQALAGETAAAWRSFGKATALGFGHDPTAVLGASFLRMREGRWDEAAQILVGAIARHAGFLHARGYLGELYLSRKQYPQALATFDEYLVLVPQQPWVLAQRGYAKAKLGDLTGAIADSTAAADLVPGSPYLKVELGSRYIDAGKLLGAEEVLQAAIEVHPDNSTAYVRLGYVYLLQGKDDLVIPVTEKALSAASFGARPRDRGYAHLNLVRAYGHRGELDRAFSHLGEAKKSGVSLDELERDTALDGLRKDPRYKRSVR